MNRPSTISWDNFCAVVAIVAVLGLYAWTDGAAYGLQPASGAAEKYDYYNHLVHGFMKGHLYLDVEVPAALKALPDPYDPAANREVGLIDTSYYRGHYYLYFGPAPALTLMLPYRILAGSDLPAGWAVLIFVSVGYVAAAVLWLALRRRYFPHSSAWTAPAGVLAIGFGCMVGAVLRRPLFWELAVAAGFAFAMLTLASLYRSTHRDTGSARWLAAAGVLLGLAVASRPTYLFGVPLLVIPLIQRWRQPDRWRLLSAAVVPFTAVLAGILAYNHARFGQWFEFGHNYQLSVAYESKVRQLSPSYFWYNLRLYYFLPGRWSWQPPFVFPTPTPVAERPAGFYTVDEVYGVFAIAPFAALSLFAPLALRRRQSQDRIRFAATLAGPAFLLVGVGGILLFFVAAVARYMVDFVPALMILAAVGLLVIDACTCTTSRRVLGGILIGLLLAWTVFASSVANFEVGHTLPRIHPRFMAVVSSGVARLESAYDRLAGRRFGPVRLELKFHDLGRPRTETLLRTGTVPEQDSVLVQYLPDRSIRFGVQHGTVSTRWTAPQPIDAAVTHRLQIDLGSFYPRLGHRFFSNATHDQATSLSHRVAMTLDGKSMLETVDAFFPSAFGAPRQIARDFSGSSVDLRRVSANPDQVRPASPPDLVLHVPAGAGGAGQRLPLVGSGRNGAGDMLFLEWLDAAHARLGYDHWAAPLVLSPAFSLDRSQPHDFRLRQDENRWAPPLDTTRMLLARMDGSIVWQATVPAYGCTPDQVFIGRNPNGHSSCSTNFPGLTWATAAPAMTRDGGSLLIRIVLPPGIKSAWYPLLTIGRPGATDAFSIYYIDTDAIELRFDHRGSPLVLSRRIELGPNAGHDVVFSLPSFDPDHFGAAASGDLRVRWDGVEVIRCHTDSFGFAPGQLVFGERPRDSTWTEEQLDAAIVRREWVPR